LAISLSYTTPSKTTGDLSASGLGEPTLLQPVRWQCPAGPYKKHSRRKAVLETETEKPQTALGRSAVWSDHWAPSAAQVRR
jgi:hypothetical protein